MSVNFQFSSISPASALSNVSSDYAYGVANELGVDVNMIALGVFGAVNTLLLSAKCEVSLSHKVGNSLYLLVGAPPSSGKSPCVERVLMPVKKLLAKHLLLSNHERQLIECRAKIVNERQKYLLKQAARATDAAQRRDIGNELAELEREAETLKVPNSPLMGSMSLYSVTKELALRGGVGAIIDAEGGLFAEMYSVAKEQTRPVLKSWSSEALSETTKSRHLFVENPVLTQVAYWQTAPMLAFLRNPKYYDTGMVARILPYRASSKSFNRTGEARQESQQNFEALLERILLASLHSRNTSDMQKFRLSDDAYTCYRKYKDYTDQLASPGGLLCDYPEVAGKLDVQAIKLAMVLHAMEASPKVSEEIYGKTMLTACQLSLFFAEQHAEILGTAYDRKMIEEGQELIELLIQWGKGNYSAAFPIEQLKRPVGYSKGRCDRVLYWLQLKQAVTCQLLSIPQQDGKLKQVEHWHPHIRALEALLSS